MASTRLFGRMSVQFSSTQSRHSFFLPFGPTADQPAGISLNVGHKEYCPSWFTRTMNSPFSFSNGFVMQFTFPLIYFLVLIYSLRRSCYLAELLVQDLSNHFYRRRLRHLIVLAMNCMDFHFSADVRLPGAGQSILAFLNVRKKEQNVTVVMGGPEFLLQDRIVQKHL